jgi:hypothetical protein
MKKLLFMFILMPLFTLAQEYSEVVEVPGKSSDQLYSTAREWFAETFKSANNVLQMDDPIAGKLIGKASTKVSESYVAGGMIKVPMTIDWYPNFTIKVSVKDGRYKCEIIDITIKTPGQNIGTTTTPDTEIPFNNCLEGKEFNKNASDPEWLFNNPPQGSKISKSAAKSTAPVFNAMYNLTSKTEIELNAILVSLQKKMKNSDDNW